MFFIKLLFTIFTIISKTNEFYDLKYGNLILKYYEDEGCLTKPVEEIMYPIEPDQDYTLMVLNTDNFPMIYSFDFNFFSSEIIYTNATGDESEEDEEYIYKRSFVCNGLCYKRIENSDILIRDDDELTPDYDELNRDHNYYSCIYNNIINSSKITITSYSDKKCQNQESKKSFNGTEFCWKFSDFYIYKPLYFEDDNKRIYYHAYNTNDCTSEYIEYFIINKNYFTCDNKCTSDDALKYYKCKFEAISSHINLKIFLLFLCTLFIF